ncbi:hypothetical protein SAMCCGM7_pA0174 (plasmid) [Sinorhizobium americanum CCGM7]|nr:hypothetical protein SAMCCGM7_pA0174 [Sinorhizobium americanum CCGM7]
MPAGCGSRLLLMAEIRHGHAAIASVIFPLTGRILQPGAIT